MKVKINDIKGEPLELKQTVPASEIGLLDEKIFRCLTPLSIVARLEKINKAIIGEAVVKGKIEFLCARCLEPIEQERCGKLDLYFEIDPTIEYIDIGEDIRQELLIDFCSIALCRVDCKGICSGCGANLNIQTCSCEKK